MNKKLSASQIAALTDIPKTTVFRIIREFKRNGTVAAYELGFCGRPQVLDYIHTELLKRALEWNETLRAQYVACIASQYTVEQLVFVDESACDQRAFLCNTAWALEGRCACRKQFFNRGKCFSILPAISLDGTIDCTIVQGTFNTKLFMEFIASLLDKMHPFPGNQSVIVMDNCPIHKAPKIRELIESRGVRLEFLPPYSPDYNPIELAFSIIKSRLKQQGPSP
ncbi:hypothetical protein A7U60_g4326 [Sanghuangporus baumii]|uniref:Tc1-like transposase DDE domain-containing protein n=1 Tax=Sanghuangporus baumii TaxID=108892 RepID=A0A9Q5HYS0_SANBA|nr:hypothetical protein A7U60_g4326 [Sanghuangporus baumii]